MREAAGMMAKAATAAGVSTEKYVKNLMAEARSPIGPTRISITTTQWRRRRSEIMLMLRIPWSQEGLTRRTGTSQRIQDRMHWPKVFWQEDPRGENAKRLEPQATRKLEAL
jgi:hypothetical protein